MNNDKDYCSTESCPNRSECWRGVKADTSTGVFFVTPFQPDGIGQCDGLIPLGEEVEPPYTPPPPVVYFDHARAGR